MRMSRIVAIGSLALGLLGSAFGQFTGPIPLAWRWAYSTPVSPVGVPAVADGVVYTAVGQRVFALDQATGNHKWRYPLVDPIPGYFRSAPLLVGNVVVAACDNNLIYGITADRGEAKWTYISDVPIIGQPVAVGNMVVFALNDSTVMAINAETGAKAWNAPYKVFAGLTGQIGVFDKSVLFFAQDNSLTSLNVLTLKVNWSKRFTNVNIDSQPTVYGEYIYTNAGSYVVCMMGGNGAVRWQQNTGEPLTFAPAVSASGVLSVSRDGLAFLYDPLNGAVKWRKPVDIGSYPSVRPSATDKLFIQPTTAGSLVALNPSGQIVWSFLVRPMPGSNFSSGTGSGSGRGGPGAGSGGGSGLAGGGGAGTAQQNQQNQIPLAIPASGPALLVGKSLMVLAQDGSLLCFDPDNGVDLTGPKVQMIWPNPGDLVGKPPLEMLFSVDDEATGVNTSTVKIQIDGQDVEFEYGRDGIAIVKISPFTKNKPLADGRRVIKVMATDWMGNTTTKEYAIIVDNSLPTSVRPGGPATGAGSGRTGGPGAGAGGGGRLGGGGL